MQGKPVLTDAFTWIVDPIDVSGYVAAPADVREP